MKKFSQRKREKIERTVANDRSYKLVVYNRFFVFAISVLVQITSYVLLLFVLDEASSAIVRGLFSIASIIFVVYIINKHDRLTGKLPWIILILIFPFVGIIMYLSFGEGKPTRKMHAKIQAAKELRKDLLAQSAEATNAVAEGPRNLAVSNYLTTVAGYPAYADGTVEYYPTGEQTFEGIKTALRSAEKFILMEYFILSGGELWKELRTILLEKAERGVKIFILYDDFGSLFSLPPKYAKYLESMHPNIKCHAFNRVIPVFALRLNNRDHRKILVVDGKVAFTGGVNIADEYVGKKIRFGYWKDSGIKITGSAVNSFTAMFLDLWNAFCKEKEDPKEYMLVQKGAPTSAIIQPYDDSPLDKISAGEAVYSDLINGAKKRVWIFTPYLILDDYMRAALCHASLRGVDVRIVTPGIPDKKISYRLTRANYELLLESGVKIYEYTPGFIHSKSMLCDDEAAVVGTINLDYRSLYHHFENAVLFSDRAALKALERDCEETFAVSRLCSLDNPKRGVVGRFFDAILRLFETLF
ncbi:MAG: cardiolipin synthase [Clostridia bacterium]|nr:cardiolipin synthase [Clostridia bacterium]